MGGKKLEPGKTGKKKREGNRQKKIVKGRKVWPGAGRKKKNQNRI